MENKFKFLQFDQAREFVRNLGIKTQKDWRIYCKSGNKPKYIPSNPNLTYKHNGWLGIQDFLGTNPGGFNGFLSFDQAREFVRKLNFKNKSEWDTYCKSGDKPNNIPSDPSSKYKNEFKGYPDFLGNENGKLMSRGYTQVKWTLCNIIKISKKYTDFKDFKDNESRCFAKAKRMKILNYITKHMIKHHGIEKRYLYKCVFSDNYVYIGLAHNLEKRKKEHLNTNFKRRTAVGEHISKTGIIPTFTQIGFGFVEEIAILEKENIEIYNKNGFNILNRSKGGEIGTSISKITKEECLKVSLKYKSRKDLKNNNLSIYQKIIKSDWDRKEFFKHMTLSYTKNRWNYETCMIEALKYKTRNDFRKNAASCYIQSKKYGFFEEITKHMISGRIKN